MTNSCSKLRPTLRYAKIPLQIPVYSIYRSISLSALIMSREHSCRISGLRTHHVDNKYLSISAEIRFEKSALLWSLLSISCLLHTLARVDAVVTSAPRERMFSQAVNYATRKKQIVKWQTCPVSDCKQCFTVLYVRRMYAIVFKDAL